MGLRDKYGRFVEYIHFLNSSHEGETLRIVDPDSKRTFDLPTGDITWKPLTKD